MTRTRKNWMRGREALYQELGARLREERLDAGLRLEDVERLTGIWGSHLSQAERGIAMVKLHELLILARLYECAPEELLTDLPL